jgi:AcrR family transcriptional regulator
MSVYSLSVHSSNRRQLQKEQTAARILASARDLFAARGVLATPTADIASAAAISHGAVFVHFPTRDDLLIALVDQFGRDLAAEIKTAVGAEASLRTTLERHLTTLEQHEDLYARLIAEGPLLPERVRAGLAILQSAVSYELHRAAAIEARAGTVRDIPQHLLFNTWIGLVHHYLINRDLFAPGRSVIRAHRRELVDHFHRLVSIDRRGARR